MPSAAESYILLAVLAVVFASLPVAILFRRRIPGRPGFTAALPPPMLPPLPPLPPLMPATDWNYAPPLTAVAMPMPPPLPAVWGKKDAWFALGLALIVALLMGPVAPALVAASGSSAEDIKMEYTVGLFITQIVLQASIIGIVLAYLCLVRKFRLVPLFGLRAMSLLKTTGIALLCLIGAYLILILVSAAAIPLLEQLTGMKLKPQSLVESAPQITDPAARFLMFVTLCIGAPLMEELIFRGVLYNVAARFIHHGYACIATAIFFGVIHNNLYSLIPLTALGIILAESYRRTRSLAVPVILHALFNCVSFLILTYGPPELRQ